MRLLPAAIRSDKSTRSIDPFQFQRVIVLSRSRYLALQQRMQEQTNMALAALSHEGRKPAAAWGAVHSMALCVAMLIASEFMPVSLLTPMAEGLRASEGQTGQAISISGLFAVAASMLITTAAG